MRSHVAKVQQKRLALLTEQVQLQSFKQVTPMMLCGGDDAILQRPFLSTSNDRILLLILGFKISILPDRAVLSRIKYR